MPHPNTPGTSATSESTNWAGIIDMGTGAVFTGVSGDWKVPSVQSSPSAEFSATWVGIDGATNSSLIQTGTAQQSGSGGTSYSAWFEILPAPATTVNAPVSPGDDMQASVVEGPPGTWTISIADVTANWIASGAFAYSGPASSAEWIEEAPTINGTQSTLANFGAMTFSNLGPVDQDHRS